ncbi:DUF5320 domain-containing protein [Geobacillus subterraneus]|uniref:DUF5320 domain-containing protein n=1 Tax=Geobacillus subterraneus TaxID=129338 RepID=UPI001611741C
MLKFIYKEISPQKYEVGAIFFEFDENEPLKENEMITNKNEQDLPIAEYQIGKMSKMYYNPTNDEFFIEYVDRPLTPEEKLQLLEQENQDLKNQIELMKQALDDLLLGGM